MQRDAMLGVVALAVLLAGCAAPAAVQPSAAELPPAAAPALAWLEHAVGPLARTEVAVAQVGTRAVAIGGFPETGAATAQADVYDLAADAWSRAPDYPFPVHHHAAVGIAEGEGGFVLVMGGWMGAPLPDPFPLLPAPTPLAFRWDLGADRWTPIAPLPEPRAAHAAGVLDGKVYVVGGLDPRFELTPKVLVYDPAADQWSEAAPLPTPRDHLGVAVLEGKLYALAGQFASHANSVDVVEAYDAATGAWEPIAPAPTKRNGIAVAAWEGRVVILGGQTDTDVFPLVEAYDPATKAWAQLLDLPQGRHGFGAAVQGPRLFALLGGTIAGSVQDVTPTVVSLGPAP